MFGANNVGMVCTNHTYASQDMFDPDDKISGGQGFIYASSIVVAMKKFKLKKDADGKKITKVRGIRAQCKVMKTRYTKPFEMAEVYIPYDTGLDPYSGLIDAFKEDKESRFEMKGSYLKYTFLDGTHEQKYQKEWTDEMLDRVMEDITVSNELQPLKSIVETDDEAVEDAEEGE